MNFSLQISSNFIHINIKAHVHVYKLILFAIRFHRLLFLFPSGTYTFFFFSRNFYLFYFLFFYQFLFIFLAFAFFNSSLFDIFKVFLCSLFIKKETCKYNCNYKEIYSHKNAKNCPIVYKNFTKFTKYIFLLVHINQNK